jgi:hypothetical protein
VFQKNSSAEAWGEKGLVYIMNDGRREPIATKNVVMEETSVRR